MATVSSNPNDLSDDVLGLLLHDSLGAHDEQMAEIMANAEGAASVVRFSGARKFNQEDPIEAACAEKILKTT